MPLKFPREEYIQRCDKLRALMEKHHLHGVVLTNHQNVNYFAGITSILAGIPGGYGTVRPLIVVVPLRDDPVVIVQFTDYGNALANSWISDVRSWVELPFHHKHLESVLVEKGLHRIGMELSREFHLGIPYQSFEGAQGGAAANAVSGRCGSDLGIKNDQVSRRDWLDQEGSTDHGIESQTESSVRGSGDDGARGRKQNCDGAAPEWRRQIQLRQRDCWQWHLRSVLSSTNGS